MSDFENTFFKRLDNDDKYKKILGSVDDDIRKEIDKTVKSLMGELCKNLKNLESLADDPDAMEKLRQLLREKKG